MPSLIEYNVGKKIFNNITLLTKWKAIPGVTLSFPSLIIELNGT